jgi:hypothetical protein
MNEKQKSQWVVRIKLVKGGIRYGQNRSATFDYSPFVLTLDKAKRFDSCEQAVRWCKRQNLDNLFCGPQPFLSGYDCVEVDKAERESRTGTEHVGIGSVTLSTFLIPNTPA